MVEKKELLWGSLAAVATMLPGWLVSAVPSWGAAGGFCTGSCGNCGGGCLGGLEMVLFLGAGCLKQKYQAKAEAKKTKAPQLKNTDAAGS